MLQYDYILLFFHGKRFTYFFEIIYVKIQYLIQTCYFARSNVYMPVYVGLYYIRLILYIFLLIYLHVYNHIIMLAKLIM